MASDQLRASVADRLKGTPVKTLTLSQMPSGYQQHAPRAIRKVVRNILKELGDEPFDISNKQHMEILVESVREEADHRLGIPGDYTGMKRYNQLMDWRTRVEQEIIRELGGDPTSWCKD